MRRKSPSKTAGEALQTRRMSLGKFRTWSFSRVRVGQRDVEEPRQSCMHGTPVAGDATPKGGAHQGCGGSETRMQGEHKSTAQTRSLDDAWCLVCIKSRFLVQKASSTPSVESSKITMFFVFLWPPRD